MSIYLILVFNLHFKQILIKQNKINVKKYKQMLKNWLIALKKNVLYLNIELTSKKMGERGYDRILN